MTLYFLPTDVAERFDQAKQEENREQRGRRGSFAPPIFMV